MQESGLQRQRVAGRILGGYWLQMGSPLYVRSDRIKATSAE